ncbi:MAG TPA: ABC transporter substrate-binding protein [Alphaproteobacteria bacterium]|nr:ABC transporter substrate-binding protein [Alphaproteobacteria bacterium]
MSHHRERIAGDASGLSRLPAWGIALIGAAALAAVIPGTAGAASVAAPQRIAGAGKITYCSDMTGPPLEFLDENTKPVGSDIDIGNEIAKRFGVKAEWKNIPFKGLVPALLAQQCDAVISQLFDKPERRQVIDLVDYMNSSEALLVRAGNPKKVHSLDDLSGLKVAVENGTTIQSLIEDQNKKFQSAGKKPAEVVVYPKDTDALQALQIGQADVYGTTLETGAYYMGKSPKTFEVAGPPFHQILTAIGLRKDDSGMKAAIEKAVDGMRQDGTLLAILKKWGLEADMMH